MLLVIHLKIHCQTQYYTGFSLFSRSLMFSFIIHLELILNKLGVMYQDDIFVCLYMVLQNFHYHLLKRSFFPPLCCLASLSTNRWPYFCRPSAGSLCCGTYLCAHLFTNIQQSLLPLLYGRLKIEQRVYSWCC